MKLSKSYNAFGMAALGLALAFSFSACDNPTQVEGTVGISSQDGLDVTVTPVKGGVLLEWNPVLDASYTIWRVKAEDRDSDPAVQPKQLDIRAQTNKATGKVYVLDLVSDTNELVADKEYIYTIVTEGPSKTASKTEVPAKPTDIPEQNTHQLTTPSGLKMDLDQKKGKITVTWTKPDFTTVVPATYYIVIMRDGNIVFDNQTPMSRDNVSPFETSATFDWPEYMQDDGVYQAGVAAFASSYFKQSEPFYGTKTPFESLFGNATFSVNASLSYDSGEAWRFNVRVTSSHKSKTNVGYALEKAKLDANGNAGTYNLVNGAWEKDTLDYLQPIVDTIVFANAGEYTYRVTATRVTATKETETQIKAIGSTVKLDKYELGKDDVLASINIASPVADSTGITKTYQIHNVSNYKNILANNDKLIVYLSRTEGSRGPYEKTQVEFTKAQLESGTSQTLSISGFANVYVQAYLEFGDGRPRENVSDKILGSGVNYKSQSGPDNYARLYN